MVKTGHSDCALLHHTHGCWHSANTSVVQREGCSVLWSLPQIPLSKQKATCKGNSASHLIPVSGCRLWLCPQRLCGQCETTEGGEQAFVPLQAAPAGRSVRCCSTRQEA